MVVHNQEQQQALSTQREKRVKPPKEKKGSSGRWSVLTVQSLACAVMLFLVVLFRMAGGGAYEELRQGVRSALMKNEWMTALARLWDGKVELSVNEEGETVVKNSNFTPEEALYFQGSFGTPSNSTSHV